MTVHSSPARSAALALRLLSLAYFWMGTGALAVVGALPVMAGSLGLSEGAVAFLVSAYSITFAVGAPILQVMVGHLPRRTLLLCGLSVMAVSAVGTGLAPNYPVLLAMRVLAALGAAAVGPVASAMGSGLVPPSDQGRALAVVFSGMTVALVIGVPLSAWGAAVAGWRVLFVAIGVLTASAALLIGLRIADRVSGQRVRLGHLLDALRSPAIVGGLAVMVLEMAGLFATYTLIAPILHDQYGADAGTVSLALLVYGVAGVGGNLVARRLGDRWAAETLIAASLLVMAGAFLAMRLLPGHIAAALVVLVAWALASDVFMPSQQRRMVELAPGLRGLVLALNASCIYVGMAAGSFVAGSTSSLFGLEALPYASVLLILLGLGALGRSRGAMKREDAAAEDAGV
ncbi:MFS transporter [Azospirillum sp. TSO35-2]|uniref:MFS transporter n=1 Tax=Azospirillum sp. TSO35-2 TaxID=716796 RepID=UPI000D605889|nr:MFS transporter [Azospirillum sp. TSO35-2]PWC39496.1 hypothetical protein TSO352_04945 [Azospirillum sp. TSO35-2]